MKIFLYSSSVYSCHLFLIGLYITGIPHYKHILYQLSHQGSPRILEWLAYPFSITSSQPRNQSGVSDIAGGFFSSWATKEAPKAGYIHGNILKYLLFTFNLPCPNSCILRYADRCYSIGLEVDIHCFVWQLLFLLRVAYFLIWNTNSPTVACILNGLFHLPYVQLIHNNMLPWLNE